MDWPVAGVLTVLIIFTVINGINDGAALVAAGLKMPVIRPQFAVLLLVAAVAAIPLILGTRVAVTLATRLVSFEGDGGRVALLAAIASATAIALLLARRGLPTSLTLALIGAIAGAGIGSGLPVAWGVVAQVLLMAAVAPLVGGILAFGIMRLLALAPVRTSTSSALSRLHIAAYGLQCAGYAANDGQKMLAVFAVGFGTTTQIDPAVLVLVTIGLFFGLGTAIGLPRMSGTIGGGIIAARPLHTIAAEFASAGAVMGMAALGTPVSMTQAIAGGLVGTGVSDTSKRVRWQAATRIVLAWVFTLPAAAGAGAVLSLAGRGL